jgi:tripartite ATP-independent transporter DctM subunit
MEWWAVLLIGFGLLILLMLSGIPVAFAFAGLNIVGVMWVTGGTQGLVLLTGSIVDSVGNFRFIAAPMFFLMGAILYRSGAFGLIIEAVDQWIGRVRARLLYVTMISGTLLATLSGAGIADTALLGTTLYPEMEKRGYSPRLSLGTIFNSGLLAAIIPPSGLAVLTATLAHVPVGRLLVAGFLPGLMMATTYAIFVFIRVRLNPALAPIYDQPPASMKIKLYSTAKLAPFSIVLFMVMGFILLGITTPSEAAATGAIGALGVALIYRRFSFGVLTDALRDSMRIATMILMIISGSIALSQTLALSGATRGFLDMLVNLPVSSTVLLLAMLGAILILGLFLDQVSMMMVAIPVFSPAVGVLGFDPIWFWMLFLIAISIGAETPPFGLVLFALKGVVPNVSITEIYRAAIPFVILDLISLGVLIAFPDIVLFLPNASLGP